ncbi:MAG: carboxypeptidase-like regulatory domain-containing protein [Candidatus Sulfotelmatobacter sp.]
MKLRQLGFSVLIAALSFPAWAANRPAVLSGYVRDASGTPQMGAVVQIVGAASRSLTVFTDASGFFSAKDLLPGLYSVKISAPSFLPAMLEKVGLRPGGDIHLRVTLNTLLNAVNITPRQKTADDDDWKWTLRSAANRPVLRVLDDPASAEQQGHDLKASLSFLAGSAAEGYGSGSDMSTGFSVERSIFSTDRIGLTGNVAYGDGLPTAFLRASYAHRLPDGSGPTMALAVRRFAPSDPYLGNATLQSVSLNTADNVTLSNVVELKFGSQLETIQFLGRVSAFRPYGSLNFHLSPNTVFGYDYATSLPNTQLDGLSDSTSSDVSESDPRLTVENYATKLESAHHQELNVSHRIGNDTSVQVAVFSDRVDNTALLGAGEVTAAGGYLLPDVYSGTFSYSGGTLDTRGFRLVLQRKFRSDLSATFDYAYGGALDLSQPDVQLQQARQWISTERRHAIAAKLSGNLPGTHTRVIASYRWLSGPALTPVDMFNASPGETDPFFSLVVRQPIPTLGFLPAHMEALIDLRNLLAEGYVPVMGRDGQTVYLVQAARSVRGGVAISF